MSSISTPNVTTAAAPLILHHLNNSRSQRIIWLLEELQVPYEIKFYQRTSQQLAPPELQKIHPLGKSPVLQDGNRIIAESGLIVEYLIEKYDTKNQFNTKNDTEDVQFNNRYWMYASEGSIMPYLLVTAVLRGVDSQSPWLIRPIAHGITANIRKLVTGPSLRTYLTYIEDYLKQQKTPFFVSNHLTACDFMLSFPLEGALQAYPQYVGELTRAWIERIHSRDAYKRGIEKGGEYAYAKM